MGAKKKNHLFCNLCTLPKEKLATILAQRTRTRMDHDHVKSMSEVNTAWRNYKK